MLSGWQLAVGILIGSQINYGIGTYLRRPKN